VALAGFLRSSSSVASSVHRGKKAGKKEIHGGKRNQ
jgi:hypothetical protein